jgi:Eukaryotic aspartyl protease
MSIDDATTLNQALDPGAIPDNGNFQISCQILSGEINLEFIINGTAFAISPQDFVGPQTTGGLCVSYIVGLSTNSDTSWSFGTGFLRNVTSPSG